VPTAHDPTELLTKDDVCAVLRVHVSTLNRMIVRGDIRIVNIGRGVDPRRGAVRITRRALDEYIATHEVFADADQVDDDEAAGGTR
jgi:excisionase family DNA binding protein